MVIRSNTILEALLLVIKCSISENTLKDISICDVHNRELTKKVQKLHR